MRIAYTSALSSILCVCFMFLDIIMYVYVCVCVHSCLYDATFILNFPVDFSLRR